MFVSSQNNPTEIMEVKPQAKENGDEDDVNSGLADEFLEQAHGVC
jgi:hypothetical protein